MTSTAEAVRRALETNYKGRMAGVEFRCRSPFRAESNDPTFAVKFISDEYGMGYDHKTGQGYSLYDIADQLNIPLPDTTPVYSSKRSYTSLADYAEAHGAPVEAFITAKWSPDVIQWQNRPALCYKTAGGKRVRFIDGQRPTYTWQDVGAKPCWYGLKAVRGETLVIVNGEASVVVGQHWGLPCAAVLRGEKSAIPGELLSELVKTSVKTVIVALDCDSAGRKASPALVEQFKAAGYDAKSVNLGLGAGGDFADFCKLWKEEAVGKVLTLPEVEPFTFDKAQFSDDLTTLLKEVQGLRHDVQVNGADPDILGRLGLVSSTLETIRIRHSKASVVGFDALGDEAYAVFKEALASPGGIRGASTSLPKVDAMIGGLRPTWLFTALGDTKAGKTHLCTTVAVHNADNGILICSTEKSPLQYFMHIAAARVGMPAEAITDGVMTTMRENGELSFRPLGDFEKQMLTDSIGYLMDCSSAVLPDFQPTPEVIDDAFKRAEDAGRPFKGLVLDQITTMGGEGEIYERTTRNVNGVKALLLTHNVWGFAASQVGRKMEGKANPRPGLHSAQGAGTVEQVSDVLLGLYNLPYLIQIGALPQSAYAENGWPAWDAVLLYVIAHRHKRSGTGKASFSTFLKFVGGSRFETMNTEHIDLNEIAYGGWENDDPFAD